MRKYIPIFAVLFVFGVSSCTSEDTLTEEQIESSKMQQSIDKTNPPNLPTRGYAIDKTNPPKLPTNGLR